MTSPPRGDEAERIFFPPSLGYPLWGCSSAEPHAVSPSMVQYNESPEEKKKCILWDSR